MSKNQPLSVTMHLEPAYYTLVRIVGYEGIGAAALEKEVAAAGLDRWATALLARARADLLATGERSGLVCLNPEARRLARVILGPEPGSPDFAEYWARNEPVGLTYLMRRKQNRPATSYAERPPDATLARRKSPSAAKRPKKGAPKQKSPSARKGKTMA